MNRNVCLIPIRSGSKGLKNKNMLFFDGDYLVMKSVKAAFDSKLFKKEDIIVSTDSVVYKEILESKAVNVILRAPELASDTVATSEVVIDFLKNYDDNINLCLLQATSPLRDGKCIVNAFNVLKEDNVENVVSVSIAEKSRSLYTTISKNGTIDHLESIDKGYRRQNSEKEYIPNGAIYITTKESYEKNKSFFTKETYPYVMEKVESIDIDDLVDFNSSLGNLYFDYKNRESNNKEAYIESFKNTKIVERKIIIGDSRMTGIEIPGFQTLDFSGITAITFFENEKLLCFKGVDKIIINLGVNDLLVENDIEVMLKLLTKFIKKYNNVEVIEVIPTLFWSTISNDEIVVLNSKVLEVCKKQKVLVHDISDGFTNKGNLDFKLTYDGLHYNALGEETLKRNLYKRIIGDNK